MRNKKLLIKTLILITLIIVISLSACFDQSQDNSAKLVISFGNAERAVYNPNDTAIHQKLEYKITLANEAETLNFSAKGGTTFEANVAPGNWNLSVVSYLDGDVYAAGSKDVTLISGLNNETLNMYQAHSVKFVSNGGSPVQEQIVFHKMKAERPLNPTHKNFLVFDGWYDSLEEIFDFENKLIFESVTLYAKWKPSIVPENADHSLLAKLNWISANAVDGGNYIVTVNKDEEIAPQTLSYGGKSVSITLKSNNMTTKTISLNSISKGSLFTVGSGVTLKLDDYITLKGHDNNTKPLVDVRGKFIMGTFSQVIDNKNMSQDGGDACGGVHVKGTFIMNGGEISNNSANQGAGVWVGSGGNFTMNGGKIKKNHATVKWGAGGVKVIYNSTFTMNGGEIFENTTEGSERSLGGGVSVEDESIFTMNDGKIYANTTNGWGGGLHIYLANFIMNGGEIYSNTAQRGGGVVVSEYATFTMNSGKIYDNSAEQKEINQEYFLGGGVYVYGGKFEMSGGEIYRNTAGSGDGVDVDTKGTFIMKAGKIFNNIGDGVTTWKATFEMHGGNIFGNRHGVSANGESYGDSYFLMNGGKINKNTDMGVYANAKFDMSGGNISENEGDGVFLSGNGHFLMKGGTITNNKRGINAGEGGYFILDGGIISSNTLNGVNLYDAIFVMNSGEISDNSDGGVWVDKSTFTMNGGLITDNTKASGGGVDIYEGTFTMNGGEISGNTASNGNGGGVNVWEGIFDKKAKATGGGVISGNYLTKTDNSGSQVYANRTDGPQKYKNNPIQSNQSLYYNGTTDPPTITGTWEN